MKLNLHLVSEYLQEVCAVTDSNILTDELWLEQPYLYYKGALLLDGNLYVADASDFDSEAIEQSSAAFVFIGRPRPECSLSCQWLATPEGEQLGVVFNRVQRAFAYYSKWHDDLHDAVFNERGMQLLFDISLPVFDNPIIFSDLNYHIIAFSEDTEKLDTADIYGISQTRKFRESTVNSLKYHPEFEDAFHKTEPAVWHDYEYDFDTLYANVSHNGRYFGRIGVDERVRRFRKGDFALLDEFRKIVELAVRRQVLMQDNYQFFEKRINKLLDGTSTDLEGLSHDLEVMGWQRYEDYFCTVLYLSQRDINVYIKNYTCEQIELRMPKCRAIPYNDNILIIARLQDWNESKKDFMSRLAPFLREGLFKAGVSQKFSDFYELRDYYNQAMTILRTGLASSGTDWIFGFDEYILEHILNCCTSELPPKLLCHNSILALIEYDKKKGTSYFKTLKTYLECNSSPSQAMEKLHVHRSTFLYRLSRINELTSIDYENPDMKLYLLIMFRLLDSADCLGQT